MFGREVIYTDVEVINESNVRDVLREALTVHDKNRREIQHLYDVYRGKHSILSRIKEVRPEINNKIVVNYPYRIVRFKTGYDLGEPIQYVSKTNNQNVLKLNEYVEARDKRTNDIALVEWVHIGGQGYRYAMATPGESVPFTIATLDPRYTFVVFDRKIEHNQKMCCTFSEDSSGKATYYVYTDTESFVIKDDKILSRKTYFAVRQPIVEYHFNNAYLGSFEPVETMCDAINSIASDRLDGLDQFVQAFMLFKGINVDSDDFVRLKQEGALVAPPDGDVEYIISELNQSSTQTLLDNMYQQLLEIVGMPNRNGGYSTSDTGLAVIYRDGWSDAEAYAKSDEMMFKRSENQFLSLIIDICNNLDDMNISVSDIEINFTRRNYENIAQKSEVLLGMLSSDKIHPKLAFTHSGMFPDPESAYKMSAEYAEEMERKEMQDMGDDSDPHRGSVLVSSYYRG